MEIWMAANRDWPVLHDLGSLSRSWFMGDCQGRGSKWPRSIRGHLGPGRPVMLPFLDIMREKWTRGRINSLTPGRCIKSLKYSIWYLSADVTHFLWNCIVVDANNKPIFVRSWLGAVRQQAITWANIDPDLCHHMASLDHIELTPLFLCKYNDKQEPDFHTYFLKHFRYYFMS